MGSTGKKMGQTRHLHNKITGEAFLMAG